MKCSTCFRETETDPCENCATLSEEERKLVHDSLAPAIGAIRMLNAAFEIAFGAKPR